MTYVVSEPCVDVCDRACVDECPVDSIYEGDRMLYIHPDECVDCGACTDRLGSPDIASLLGRDLDLWRAVRRSGGTVAPNGEPLTTAGWRRIRRWRQDWLGLPSQVIPAVVGHDQILRSGAEALRYLTRLSGAGTMPSRLPACAETEPGTGPRRRAA